MVSFSTCLAIPIVVSFLLVSASCDQEEPQNFKSTTKSSIKWWRPAARNYSKPGFKPVSRYFINYQQIHVPFRPVSTKTSTSFSTSTSASTSPSSTTTFATLPVDGLHPTSTVPPAIPLEQKEIDILSQKHKTLTTIPGKELEVISEVLETEASEAAPQTTVMAERPTSNFPSGKPRPVSTKVPPRFPPINERKSSDVSNIVSSTNTLGTKLFQALNRVEKTRKNILISPISLFSTLVTVYAGSSSSTQDEMINLLQLKGMKQSQVERAFRDVMHQLLVGIGQENKVKILNAILVDRNMNISTRFTERVRVYYNAYLEKVGFNSEPEYVKNWTNELVSWWTEGLISKVLDKQPDPLTRMLLINAIYFKGQWMYPFNPGLSFTADFHNYDGTKSKVEMMRRVGKCNYNCDHKKHHACAVELSYVGASISFVILIPDNVTRDIHVLEPKLNADMIKDILDGLTESNIELVMPKFSLNVQYDLLAPLEDLGMRSAFSPQSADLSQMGDSKELFVREAKHKTVIQIDEQGTVAAGSTVAEIGTRKRSVRVTIDRPFIFLIREVRTDVIMFLGKIESHPN